MKTKTLAEQGDGEHLRRLDLLEDGTLEIKLLEQRTDEPAQLALRRFGPGEAIQAIRSFALGADLPEGEVARAVADTIIADGIDALLAEESSFPTALGRMADALRPYARIIEACNIIGVTR